MKSFKLKKLLTLMSVTLLTVAVMLPIKASAAWNQSDSGNWSYTEGNASVSGWKSIDGNWYFFDSNATLKTGWINDGGSWYYAAPSGEIKTGWVNDGGKWYYTASSGAMQTGWLSNNGAWYYLSTSGDMKTGLVEVNNKTYYLSESGAMKTGNVTVNGQTYTFAASGEKITSANATSTSANATSTTATSATTASAADSSTGSSGGSGGGSSSGGSSSGGSKSTSSSYKSLYGTWTVDSYIAPQSKTLSQEAIDKCLNQQFTIAENSVSATVPSVDQPITFKPNVTESTMTASAFGKKWSIDVNGTTVKCVKISYAGYTVNIFITDNNTYAEIKDSLFELKK